MKLLRNICFFTIIIALAGCGLSKMSTKYNTTTFTVTPAVLETHSGKINLKLEGKFPEKYFAKKAIVEFTPVLVYAEGETAFKAITINGENATGGKKTIFYEKGGEFTYNDIINYTPAMMSSKLELRAVANTQNEKESIAAITASITQSNKEQILGPVTLANGVIVTANRVANSEEVAVADHGYEKETILSESAVVYFLVNQSNIRTTEKSKDAVKKLKDFASQGNKTSSIEIKSYASPEGTIDINDNVSERRMKSTLKYTKWLMRKVGLDGARNTALYTEESIGEDWDGFNNLMSSSEIKDKRRINRIVNSVEDLEKREQAIRDMTELYDAIEKDILPQLRKARITVRSYESKKTDEEIAELCASTFGSGGEIIAENLFDLDIKEALYGVSLQMQSSPDNHELALTLYENISLAYNDWKGLNNIACHYLNNNNIAKANEYLQKAEAIGGSQNEIEINKGIIASWNGELTNAQKLFTNGNVSEKNQAILNIRKGEYEKAARFFKNDNSYNATLAKLLNGNSNVSCNESTASAYYLNAILGARNNNESATITNLKKAINEDSSYKKEAAKDLEFRNYFNSPSFQQLIN
ncbi:MAG: hypothetical protein VX347_00320 [Bacteroidota bacterium]|nr:hypothetical protein [Bacteroidota bacterium]